MNVGKIKLLITALMSMVIIGAYATCYSLNMSYDCRNLAGCPSTRLVENQGQQYTATLVSAFGPSWVTWHPLTGNVELYYDVFSECTCQYQYYDQFSQLQYDYLYNWFYTEVPKGDAAECQN